MENVKTASGSQLNNDLINQVLSASENKPTEPVKVTPPSDTDVRLPAGLLLPSGEVLSTAEVRELTGKDEEYIGKAGNVAKALAAVISRGTVKVGDLPADEKLLESLLSGDRDALLLGIFKATFGNEVELAGVCNDCSQIKVVGIDVDRDVQTKFLVDPINDRTFTVLGKKKEYLVTLPNGIAQKELTNAGDKTSAELTTILLGHCVLEIDGAPMLGRAQILGLGLVDRQKIANEIYSRIPGPQFENIEIDCDDCEGKVVVPFTLGALFRF
jgi:hypothetical protein